MTPYTDPQPRTVPEKTAIDQVDSKPANQQNGFMRTIFDLPDALIKQLKLRANHEGRKLKDAVADLLRRGLRTSAKKEVKKAPPVLIRDKQTGLPVIQCKQAASPQEEITPERAAEILLAQERDWHHAAGR